MNDWMKERADLRKILLDMLLSKPSVFGFTDKDGPSDPYIRLRFGTGPQVYRGRVWFNRASYDAKEDPLIDLKGLREADYEASI